MPCVKRLAHVILRVRDPDHSVHSYVDVLALYSTARVGRSTAALGEVHSRQ